MVIKWIKGFIKHPIRILKSMYSRYMYPDTDLTQKRLDICNQCKDRVNTHLGDACFHCGCIIENKVTLKDEHCDLCKW